jgi:hypothetical protein
VKKLPWCNPSVTGYGFGQKKKGSYLNCWFLGDFVEEVLEDGFERLTFSAFIEGVNGLLPKGGDDDS